MQMVSAAIATAMNTSTHHLDPALEAAAVSQVHGIRIRTTLAFGGGVTLKVKANMKVNGMTPGTGATITAIAAAMSTPILNGSVVRWVLRTAASTLAMAITLPAFLLRVESAH